MFASKIVAIEKDPGGTVNLATDNSLATFDLIEMETGLIPNVGGKGMDPEAGCGLPSTSEKARLVQPWSIRQDLTFWSLRQML